MSYVFDSNILIYQLSDTLSAHGAELLRTGLLHRGAYSVISRIEIMGYPQSPEELAKADQLLRGLREIPLNDTVTGLAINIRQHRKAKSLTQSSLPLPFTWFCVWCPAILGIFLI